MNIEIYKLKKEKNNTLFNWNYIISIINYNIVFDNILYIHKHKSDFAYEEMCSKNVYDKFILNISDKEYDALISEDEISQRMVIEILLNKIEK